MGHHFPKFKSMAVGTGGQGGGGNCPPPPIFCQPQKFKIVKQRHIDQCIEIWLKYVNSSVDIGNHRYTNEQNCIILKKKCY